MGRILSPDPHGPVASPPTSADAGYVAPYLTQEDASAPTQPMTPPAGEIAHHARATNGTYGANGPTWTSARQALWRAIKWPLRKLLLGAYLAGEALERRSRVAQAALALAIVALFALVAGGALIATRGTPPSAASRASVMVEQPALPALPPSVQRFLGARQRFDAAGMWNACDAQGRGDMQPTVAVLQATLDQRKQAGETVTRYVYTGGYRSPDGTARYTIAAYITDHSQTSVSTWYFEVGTNGLIHRFGVLAS